MANVFDVKPTGPRVEIGTVYYRLRNRTLARNSSSDYWEHFCLTARRCRALCHIKDGNKDV